MSGSLLWMGLAVGELLLIVFIALLVSWLRNLAMRRRDRKAIEALVAHSRGRKEERMAEIGEFLGTKYALEGEAHGYAVRALYKAEARLIQSFARTYLQRDAKAASRFHKPVEDGVGEYWSLEAGAGRVEGAGDDQAMEAAMAEAKAAEAAEETGDDGELERLRRENQSLSDELRLTMDTMGRMLNEYSSVFAKDADLGNIQVIEGEAELDGDSLALTAEVGVAGETLPEEVAETELEDPVGAQLGEDASADMTGDGMSEPPVADDDVETILQGAAAGAEQPADARLPVEEAQSMAMAMETEAVVDAMDVGESTGEEDIDALLEDVARQPER